MLYQLPADHARTALSAQEHRLRFAETLADAAGRAILPHFRAAPTIDDKADPGRVFDPVTIADRAAEQAMRVLIEAQLPDDGIIGEEFGNKPSRNGWTWILDPIDGTRGFIIGAPTWGVLIGLYFHGVPVLGICDQPYLQERYLGTLLGPSGPEAYAIERGKRSPLKIRAVGSSLNEAILSTCDQNLFVPAEAAAFEQVRAACKLTRYGLDCYAYAMLAAGRVDLVIESGLKIYDIAALIPIVVGAGGLLTNWRGESCADGGQVIAAANAALLEETLVACRRAAKP